MLRRSQRFLIAFVSSAALISTVLSGTATAAPIIDPDQQIADFKAQQKNGTWQGAPAPGKKADSAESDLKAFPKLTEKDLPPKVQGPVVPDEHAVDVVSVVPEGNGTRVTIYSPAPGVSPEQLANILRARGKQGVQVVDHHDEVKAAAPDDCQYGSARTFTCGPVSYWHNHGWADPQVFFNDHSGNDWPTTNAVYKWNQTPNIDSYYRWNNCPGIGGTRCVDVLSGNYGVGWTGLWSGFFPNGAVGGPYQDHGQWVQLNDYYVPNGFTRNNTVTHELGHALGLGHNDWDGDVMHRYANMREDIGGQNPALLASVYSINR